MVGWLRGFDMQAPYGQRRAELLKFVACGERKDYAWVRLEPPLEPDTAGNPERLDVVLLAPRHVGENLTNPVGSELHVYVCTVKAGTADLPDQIAPDDVVILHWAVLDPPGSADA